MKNMLKIFSVVAVVLFLMTGCRTAAVYNVENYPTEIKKNIKDDKIFKAIKTAGLGLGWQVKKIKPGLAEAKLYIRSHMAEVKIPYTKDNFSIIYKNSGNLKYDAEKNTIHNNYNGWVQNLRNAIALRLSALEE